MFGIVADTLSRDLSIGLVTLLETLRTGAQGLGRVCLPTPDEQRLAADYLDAARPFPPGLRVWAFCDGTVFRVMNAPTLWLERLTYSGFHKMSCSSNICLILPTGVLAFVVLDLPGKTHDSTGASTMIRELRSAAAVAPGHLIAGDGAFAARHLSDIFIAPVGSHERVDRIPPDVRARRQWVEDDRASNEWVYENIKA